jgi:cell division septation protein DedD
MRIKKIEKTLWISSFLMIFLFLSVSCVSYQVAPRGAASDENGDSYPEKDETVACQKLSEGVYIVQAGVFRNISYAQNLRKKLEGQGYVSYIILSGTNENQKLYRVGIGNFLDKKQAEEVTRDIKNKTNIGAIVTVKPPKDKFVVQAGCFRDMTEAQDLMKQLHEKGYNAYIKLTRTSRKKNFFVVLIGEFLDQATAEKFSEKIKRQENLKVFVNTI